MTNDNLYMVVNAGCRDKDLAHLNKHLSAFKACTAQPTSCALLRQGRSPAARLMQAKGGAVDMHIHDERALIALQGPKAAAALQACPAVGRCIAFVRCN